jgi:hypothetical protein
MRYPPQRRTCGAVWSFTYRMSTIESGVFTEKVESHNL